MIKTDRRNGKYVLGLVLLVLLGLGVLAWLERAPLLAWFHVRMLVSAGDGNRAERAQRVAQLGHAAVPGLLNCLQREEPAVCVNARAGLTALVRQGGTLSETQTADLVNALSREFGQFSREGQRHTVEMVAEWFHTDPGAAAVPGLILACGRLLSAAISGSEPEVQSGALQLCLALVSQPQGAEVLSTGRELVRACLHNRDPEVRVQAIQVGLHPGMDLLEAVAGLLPDADARVRRAAILAVGPPPADRYVLDEALLPCLRDPDAEASPVVRGGAAFAGPGLGASRTGPAADRSPAGATAARAGASARRSGSQDLVEPAQSRPGSLGTCRCRPGDGPGYLAGHDRPAGTDVPKRSQSDRLLSRRLLSQAGTVAAHQPRKHGGDTSAVRSTFALSAFPPSATIGTAPGIPNSKERPR